MHVLLGSQTLGGAYSLARSTIDQMAVRVALQCSDADAQMILSKDNNAARLLSRPGEAIYNDQNGLVEGNDPFQVVWLSEEKREELLKGLGERAAGKYPPPLVFEGNSAADPARNPALVRALESPEESAAGVARRSGRDQGADRRRVPPSRRRQPVAAGPKRRCSPRAVRRFAFRFGGADLFFTLSPPGRGGSRAADAVREPGCEG
ncbi:MAG: hypothetical protein U0791_04495 [Gemmataceae bacterium]